MISRDNESSSKTLIYHKAVKFRHLNIPKIEKVDEGRTSANGLEYKKTNGNAQGLTSER